MTLIGPGTRIALKNVLFLTDFSESSKAALPFAMAMARSYCTILHALHVLKPVIPEAYHEAIQADENLAAAEMVKVGAQLAGVTHDTAVVSSDTLWSALEAAIKDREIDLIVVGTHGRTGVSKLLLGSFAEEIFRRSSVPVLTIGPDVPQNTDPSGRFRSVLFATNFGESATVAAPFAVSLAEENDAQLVLVNVIPQEETAERDEAAVTNATHKLLGLVSTDARMWCRPSTIVEHGEAAERILKVAAERKADLIVLGVRDATRHLGAATHLDGPTAHKVVAHARCPVLTVRG